MPAKRIREKLIQLIHRFYLVKIDCFDMLCFFMVPGNWPSTKLGFCPRAKPTLKRIQGEGIRRNLNNGHENQVAYQCLTCTPGARRSLGCRRGVPLWCRAFQRKYPVNLPETHAIAVYRPGAVTEGAVGSYLTNLPGRPGCFRSVHLLLPAVADGTAESSCALDNIFRRGSYFVTA